LHGTLYLVSTPIGNLEDITLRALRILKEADVVAAEDTRHSRKLLSHFEISTPLISYHQHSGEEQTSVLIARLIAGQSIALITDAGTPGVSDPGYALVVAAIEAGITVVPIPGASAVLAGLVASGVPPARFVFEGFLPRTKSNMRERLAVLAKEQRTIVLYEAGNRTAETVSEIGDAFGSERQVVVCRELTKTYEEFKRGTAREVAAYYKANPARGEVTIILAGRSSEDSIQSAQPEVEEDPEQTLIRRLKESRAGGLSERDSVRTVSEELKMSRRIVYAAMLELASEGDVL